MKVFQSSIDMKTSKSRDFPDQSLVRYLKDIADSRPLSSVEEAKLARCIQMGDIKARNKLVHANLRFVVTIALEYRHRGLTLDELVSAGNLGLLNAAERFGETRGYRFITYAVWWVRQAILQSLMDRRTVRLPVNQYKHHAHAFKSFSLLQQQLYADPGATEIAEDLGISPKEVERAMMDIRSSLSLDAPFDEESGSDLHRALFDPAQASLDEAMDQKRMKKEIRTVLNMLDDRESDVLQLYFGLGDREEMTLEEIGLKLRLTKERIRQIKEKALQKLRFAGRARHLKPYLT